MLTSWMAKMTSWMAQDSDDDDCPVSVILSADLRSADTFCEADHGRFVSVIMPAAGLGLTQVFSARTILRPRGRQGDSWSPTSGPAPSHGVAGSRPFTEASSRAGLRRSGRSAARGGGEGTGGAVVGLDPSVHRMTDGLGRLSSAASTPSGEASTGSDAA